MIVVCAGPSLYPSGDVRARAGTAIAWRGPARQGDVARAVHDGAAVIGLIDGLYGTMAAVWHKEILFALSRGVRVVGGASIGALRAVECEAFGMEGVGRIFDDYRSGALVDDGDVALLHAPGEMDYAPLTETVVDLRASAEALSRRGLLTREDAASLVATARRVHFFDRTLEAVLGRCRGLGRDAAALGMLLETHRVRAKRRDAWQVIDAVLAAPARQAAPAGWQPHPTRAFRRIAASTSRP